MCSWEEVSSESCCAIILDYIQLYFAFICERLLLDVRLLVLCSFLSVLEYVIHYILAPIASDEKLALKLIEVSLFLRNHFPLVAFKFFSLSLTFSMFTITCLGMNLCFYLTWSSFCFIPVWNYL